MPFKIYNETVIVLLEILIKSFLFHHLYSNASAVNLWIYLFHKEFPNLRQQELEIAAVNYFHVG